MNYIIKDDSCLDFIAEKMKGNLVLLDGTTEEDEMEAYKNEDHTNYFIPSGNGFLCVSVVEDFCLIPFAWHIGKHSTLKEMVNLGKELYRIYTIEKGMPIYYTGKKNLYSNHSELFADNVWVFKPNSIE